MFSLSEEEEGEDGESERDFRNFGLSLGQVNEMIQDAIIEHRKETRVLVDVTVDSIKNKSTRQSHESSEALASAVLKLNKRYFFLSINVELLKVSWQVTSSIQAAARRWMITSK